MAKTTSSSDDDKNRELNDGFIADDEDSADFEGGEPAEPQRVSHKDPTIRRRIEDMLERKRLRDELGIYDDDALEDI